MQAFQQGQIPRLPGQGPAAVAPGAAPAPPGMDATNLLGLILSNPQLQQALQALAAQGAAAPRTVGLPMPGPDGVRTVPVPLGAVLNTVGALTGPAMVELTALTREDDLELPEYLVSEAGELVVDPASPEERAALVAHLFRIAAESQMGGEASSDEGYYESSDESDYESSDESDYESSDEALDEAELFAREAGFDELETEMDETSESWSVP